MKKERAQVASAAGARPATDGSIRGNVAQADQSHREKEHGSASIGAAPHVQVSLEQRECRARQSDGLDKACVSEVCALSSVAAERVFPRLSDRASRCCRHFTFHFEMLTAGSDNWRAWAVSVPCLETSIARGGTHDPAIPSTRSGAATALPARP